MTENALTTDIHTWPKSILIPLLAITLTSCGGSSGGGTSATSTSPTDMDTAGTSFDTNSNTTSDTTSNSGNSTTGTATQMTESIYANDGGREASIRLMKLTNAMVILLDAIPKSAQLLQNGVFQCSGGGTATAVITEESGNIQFNECVFFVGNTMSIDGEWQYSRTEQENRYTNLTFRTADRVVTASGASNVNAGTVSFTNPQDLVITEGQSTATIKAGSNNLIETEFNIAFDNRFEVVFEEEPNRQFVIDTGGQIEMPGFCPRAILFAVELDGVEQLEIRLAAGDNYTFTAGEFSDTIACTESGSFLETWPARHQ